MSINQPSEMRLPLRQIEATAAVRGEGYLEHMKSVGRVEGQWLYLPLSEYEKMLANPPGFGDKVARVAKPIVKAIAGEEAANCLPCSQAQADLNRALPLQAFKTTPRTILETSKEVFKAVLRRIGKVFKKGG